MFERAIHRTATVPREASDTPIDALDEAARRVQLPLRHALGRVGWLRDVLHGKFIGHPLHPTLAYIPVGAWTAALVCDGLDVLGGRTELRAGTDAVIGIGLAASFGAAAAGAADWSTTRADARRYGFVHAISNVTAAGLYGASLVARAKGQRTTGVMLSTLGWAVVGFSSWLGGVLAYRLGVRVDPRTPGRSSSPYPVGVGEAPAAPEPAGRRTFLN